MSLRKPYKTDVFGNAYFIKRLLIFTLGMATRSRYTRVNQSKIEGWENLEKLPDHGVLFVSNHQTYFAEVILMYHIFAAHRAKRRDIDRNFWYLLTPRLNVYFVAALETMKAGLLPKLFAYAGSISIKRTWREGGKAVNRKVDLRDISKIGMALDHGWVITFPQGTTKPFVKGRRGTSHIVKKFEPVVVPIVVDGFRRAFDKKGIRLKKRRAQLSIRFKEPLTIDYTQDADVILEQLMDAIEQSERFAGRPLEDPANS
ncbi:MAG TPA: lysophospholipid acyltransferase family protein [Luteibaculaceae bacterium]|nr:lysophospholipid acyltransferase family protein [Luteibaculaceae bacterium]